MASKILTESEVYNIGNKGTATANLLCTYARAEALGCIANSGYSLASNQLVYEGSVKQKETTCTYTIHSVPAHDQAYCNGVTHTVVTYSVSGAVTASNQTYGVSAKGSSCSSSSCTFTASASFTHSGCSNSRTVSWSATASKCNYSSCQSCLTIQDIDGSQNQTFRITNSCGRYVSIYFRPPNAPATATAGPISLSPYSGSYTLPPNGSYTSCKYTD